MKQRGVLQRDIAAQLGDTEQTLSGRLGGKRGITDEFVDKVEDVTGVPFVIGSASGELPSDLVTAFQDMANQAKRNNNIIDLLVEELRRVRQDLQRLQERHAQ